MSENADQALQLKHEAHRKTWRQLEQSNGLLRVLMSHFDTLVMHADTHALSAAFGEDWDVMVRAIRSQNAAALSQQAEPDGPDYEDGPEFEGWAERCGNPAKWDGEPAPAQDELRKRFDEIEFEVAQGKHSAASVFTQMRTAAMYIRPAQTEQQRIRMPCRMWESQHAESPEYVSGYNTALDRVARLNDAPIAQTALQSELPEELFDGHAVYQETVRQRRSSGLLVRTSPENVSDTLDAVVRLIKSRRPA